MNENNKHKKVLFVLLETMMRNYNTETKGENGVICSPENDAINKG